jgi:hypothetical protein
VFSWAQDEKEITVNLPTETVQNQTEYLEITQVLEGLGFWKQSNLPYYLIPIVFTVITQIALSLWLTPLGLGFLVVIMLAIFLGVGTLILIFSIRQRDAPIPPFLEIMKEKGFSQ